MSAADAPADALWVAVRRVLDNIASLDPLEAAALLASLDAARDTSMNLGQLGLAGVYDSLQAVASQLRQIQETS